MTRSDCETMRDRMPEVARGVAAWSAAEATHLAACAECRAEWAVVRAALVLGAGVEAGFDAAAAGRAVTARLKAEAAPRWPARRYLLGLAAAAALALVFIRPTGSPVAPTVVAEGRLFPELDSLTVEELTIIADGIETPLAEAPLGGDGTLNELDSVELSRVLRSLEG